MRRWQRIDSGVENACACTVRLMMSRCTGKRKPTGPAAAAEGNHSGPPPPVWELPLLRGVTTVVTPFSTERINKIGIYKTSAEEMCNARARVCVFFDFAKVLDVGGGRHCRDDRVSKNQTAVAFHNPTACNRIRPRGGYSNVSPTVYIESLAVSRYFG